MNTLLERRLAVPGPLDQYDLTRHAWPAQDLLRAMGQDVSEYDPEATIVYETAQRYAEFLPASEMRRLFRYEKQSDGHKDITVNPVGAYAVALEAPAWEESDGLSLARRMTQAQVRAYFAGRIHADTRLREDVVPEIETRFGSPRYFRHLARNILGPANKALASVAAEPRFKGHFAVGELRNIGHKSLVGLKAWNGNGWKLKSGHFADLAPTPLLSASELAIWATLLSVENYDIPTHQRDDPDKPIAGPAIGFAMELEDDSEAAGRYLERLGVKVSKLKPETVPVRIQ